jgi:hypothetical protein
MSPTSYQTAPPRGNSRLETRKNGIASYETKKKPNLLFVPSLSLPPGGREVYSSSIFSCVRVAGGCEAVK